MDIPGTLYLCATPIGNLEDITLRALRILKEVDLVAAEDTRRTRKLFSHFDIHTRLISYHDHNRRSRGPQLVEQLLAGRNLALVTDAGMPGVSDPGEELVALAVDKGVAVVPVPGASAFLTALVVSGLPAGRFIFEGFLPSQKKARRKRLEELRGVTATMVFYEAPHRLEDTLADFYQIFGRREICVARELTKKHEEIWRGSLEGALAKFREQPPRGEITLVLRGASEKETASFNNEDLIQMVAALEQGGLSRREAVREVARQARVPKREVYSAVLPGEKKED